ncbi:ABC transporter ATP-binding protein [Candidatus Bathyarchaeota archaeon]|nr:MAG: ABC transporter ATP-binding protein [Candidatus Bathyarchaeota archaeon]
MVEITLENLTKYFDSVKALDNLNLKIRDKELMVLLGPSGCGKTTTLRIIAGLEKATSGHVYFGNKLMDRVPVRERNVSMVFQSYALFPHMKVFDNIAFPLIIAKYPKDEVKKRVKEIAELLRIDNLLDRKPHQLSGGQQQRVALGRALIRKPTVLLLDEPLANLDAKLRVEMRSEIKRLQRSFESTAIYVTHDQVEAMSIADRIAVLNNGQLQQVGTPDELYHHPDNIFVAGFIGTPSMNLLDCSFDEEKSILDFGPFTLDVPENIKPLLKGSSEVIVGIRARDLQVSKEKMQNSIPLEIYTVEPLGEETIIILISENVRIRVVTRLEFKADIGENVWVSFDLNRIHIFDKKTGRAIL